VPDKAYFQSRRGCYNGQDSTNANLAMKPLLPCQSKSRNLVTPGSTPFQLCCTTEQL